MSYPTVNINRLANQLSRQGASAGENVAALCMSGVAVSGGAQLNTSYTLYSTDGAKNIGLNSAYDTANTVLVYHHIEEFFRKNSTGELHIMLVPQGTTLTNMVNKDNDFLKKLLRDGAGRIRKAGVVLNPASGYTATLTGGLDGDVLAAVPVAQQLADDEYNEGRPVNNIVIEGRQFNGSVGDATDLRNLAGGPYRDVSVVIAQDSTIAAGDALHNAYAAVGVYLGCATNKGVSQSFAQPIGNFNLTSVADGKFLTSYLSNNQALSNLAANDVSALSNKGYIFGRTFPNYDGVYFNQSHVCAPDTDDYKASELRDVMNYIVRLVHPVMIPYINSTQWTVEATGRIAKRDTMLPTSNIDAALSVVANDVSSIPYIIVDPAVDNLGVAYPSFLDDSILRVQIGVVPKGKSEVINVEIGYTRG